VPVICSAWTRSAGVCVCRCLSDRCSFSEILCVYLIILAKYQHTLFAAVHLERMEQIMRDVCADFGRELAEFNGERARQPASDLPADRGHLPVS
jgi:hypothetical protein